MFSKNRKEAPAEGSAVSAGAEEPQPEMIAEAPNPVEVADDSQPPVPAEPSPEAKELAAMKDRYTRLMADFDNFRKRQAREREEFVKRANEELLGDFLPVVDHLELALAKTPDPADPFVIGIQLVYDQIIALFNRYNLKPIDAKGVPFDPAFHEALSQMSSPTVPAHTVIDQFRRGWLLSDRLLRPAQVIVSSGTPEPERVDGEAASVSD